MVLEDNSDEVILEKPDQHRTSLRASIQSPCPQTRTHTLASSSDCWPKTLQCWLLADNAPMRFTGRLGVGAPMGLMGRLVMSADTVAYTVLPPMSSLSLTQFSLRDACPRILHLVLIMVGSADLSLIHLSMADARPGTNREAAMCNSR